MHGVPEALALPSGTSSEVRMFFWKQGTAADLDILLVVEHEAHHAAEAQRPGSGEALFKRSLNRVFAKCRVTSFTFFIVL